MPKVILPFVPNTIRIKYSGTLTGGAWTNLFYAKYVSLAGVDLNTLAANLNALWGTVWAPSQLTSTAMNLCQVWDLASPAGIVGVSTTLRSGTVSTTTNQPLPANVAVCISWSVAYRWRGGHPRTYSPAPGYADITGGRVVSAATKTRLETAATSFIAQLKSQSVPTGGLTLQMVRYFGNGSSTSNPPVPLPTPIVGDILAGKVHDRSDSMRRRLGKEIY